MMITLDANDTLDYLENLEADLRDSSGPVTEAGVYRLGTLYKVKIGRASKRPYAMAESATGWAYAPNAIYNLRASDRLTLEEAARLGKLTGSCVACNRELTHEVSVALGIGPICGGHWYGKAAITAYAKKHGISLKGKLPESQEG